MGKISAILRDAEGGNGVKYLHFWCPGCQMVHGVTISGPKPWGYNGNAEKPTFTPSILVTWRTPKGYSNDNPAPVGWQGEYVQHACHSFVTDGRIQFLGDCTHELAGQTVDLPPFNQWDD